MVRHGPAKPRNRVRFPASPQLLFVFRAIPQTMHLMDRKLKTVSAKPQKRTPN